MFLCRVFYMFFVCFLASTINLQRLQQSGFLFGNRRMRVKHFLEICQRVSVRYAVMISVTAFPHTHMCVVVFRLCFESVPSLLVFGAIKCRIFPQTAKGTKESYWAQHMEAKHKDIKQTLKTCYTFLVCRPVRMSSEDC